MDKNNASFSQRAKFITTHLKDQQHIDTTYIIKQLAVSDMTIRRDLSKLESMGLLIRTHGGARAIPSEKREGQYQLRLQESGAQKRAIGRHAASLIENGDTVFFDGSTTTQYVIPFLQHHNIQVITNSYYVAQQFDGAESVSVVVIGGELRKSSCSFNGAQTHRALRQYHIDKLFFSSKAIDITHGISDVTSLEGELKQVMLEVCDLHVLLVHSQKIMHHAFYNVAPLSHIHHLITDDGLTDTTFLSACHALGVNVHRCTVHI